MEQTPTTEAIEKLIESLEYMQHEARALTRVIDNVPHDEVPSDDQLSIGQYLGLIHALQKKGARKLVVQINREEAPLKVESPDELEQSYKTALDPQEQAPAIDQLLTQLAEERQQLVQNLHDLDQQSWNLEVETSGKTVFDWFEALLEKEQKQLKAMGNLVMIYAQQRENMREIESKRKEREQWSDDAGNGDS